jgi:hypothetical protein
MAHFPLGVEPTTSKGQKSKRDAAYEAQRCTVVEMDELRPLPDAVLIGGPRRSARVSTRFVTVAMKKYINIFEIFT